MRVLFVTCLNKSQMYLMAPLAWALRTAGHQVRVASQPDLVDDIAGLGLTPAPVGALMARLKDELAEAEPEEEAVVADADPTNRTKPVQSAYGWDDPASEFVDMATDFFPILTTDSFLDDLVAYARAWQPDLVIWNTLAFAGPIAARVSGAAHARHLWGVDALAQLRAGFVAAQAERGAEALPDPMAAWLGPKLERYGHTFDEEMVLGQWTIDPAPPSMFHPTGAGVHYVPVRQVSFNGPASVPDWVHEPPKRRRVCMTLGFSHRDSHGVEASAGELLEAVADLDIEVIATFSAKQLDSLTRVPDNVRAVEFVPLGVLLPTCAAIVHHGGPGTFATALEHGVPQLIVPGTYWHEKWWAPVAQANCVEDRGAGVYVADSDQLTAQRLRTELERVLGDPSFARNAERLRVDLLGVPSPNEIVPLLEKLTAEHRSRT
ncbi:activator-dependent family glycosyltransferase [Actinokineospora sp.]|uniref:activator-dependent family glycosyltransferase n=1 Tax=Actinokineospora sp. TaxID=1872133 RepID=UPI0040380814